MLKQGEVLTLSDNKKYSVVFSCEYENKNYVYLMDQDDYSNSIFCEFINEELEEVTDEKTLEIIMKKFLESQKM